MSCNVMTCYDMLCMYLHVNPPYEYMNTDMCVCVGGCVSGVVQAYHTIHRWADPQIPGPVHLGKEPI